MRKQPELIKAKTRRLKPDASLRKSEKTLLLLNFARLTVNKDFVAEIPANILTHASILIWMHPSASRSELSAKEHKRKLGETNTEF